MHGRPLKLNCCDNCLTLLYCKHCYFYHKMGPCSRESKTQDIRKSKFYLKSIRSSSDAESVLKSDQSGDRYWLLRPSNSQPSKVALSYRYDKVLKEGSVEKRVYHSICEPQPEGYLLKVEYTHGRVDPFTFDPANIEEKIDDNLLWNSYDPYSRKKTRNESDSADEKGVL